MVDIKMDSADIYAVVGESARIEVGEAINYIKSGQAEIGEAVQEGIASFDSNALQKTLSYNTNAGNRLSEYNSNADNKLEAYNNNATAKTNAYNQNDTEKTSAYNTNAQNKLDAYNLNDTSKTNAFNQNATDKTDAFNNNAASKTADFSTNATNKTTAFNNNASEKQAAVDASALAASQSAVQAKQWAIGDPSEPTGNSAKYWAEQASSTLSGLISRVSTIEDKIPSDASSSNRLADKNWVENKGYITGINSGDVTAALGYTPYNSSNPDGYQTASDVATAISGKQDTLVSGTNIKTINGSSVLGSGDLSVTAQIVWGSITGTLSNQADLQNALNTKANDSDVVKLAGNQNIAGVKTFLNSLYLKKGGTYSATPASKQTYGELRFFDSTGKSTGVIDNYTNTDGTTHIRLYAYLPTDTSKYSIIDLSVDKDGNWSTYAPTPATSDDSTKIATTAYVKAQGYALDSAVVKLSGNQTIAGIKTFSSSPILPTPASSDNSTKAATTKFVKDQGYVPSSSLSTVHAVIDTYKNGTSWYRVWSDGWIEQGGRVSISQDTQTTVTLLKAFSNTDYMVLISACRSGMQTGGDGNFTVEYTSSSQFKWGNGDDFSGTGIWYACGY